MKTFKNEIQLLYDTDWLWTPETIPDIVLTCDRVCYRVCSCDKTPCEHDNHCDMIRKCEYLQAHIEEREQ